MIKDEEYKNCFGQLQEPHKCFWCGQLTYAPFWSCRECYPKKEEAYKSLKGKKRNWFEIIEFVKGFI